MRIALYILSIVIANIVTARFAPLDLGLLIIPWGTLLVGCTFIFRDLVQQQIGRKKTYFVILIALMLSAISSFILGDTLWIAFASAFSFLISEASDTEIFTRFKGSFANRVLFSGIVGGVLDSAIFAIIGLSPIGAGYLPWEVVPYAILGQALVKCFMQFIGVLAIKSFIKGEIK